MIHVAAIGANVLWFFLVGVLWYIKPPELIWLIGSLAWGVTWFIGFLWYVTHSTKTSDQAGNPVRTHGLASEINKATTHIPIAIAEVQSAKVR